MSHNVQRQADDKSTIFLRNLAPDVDDDILFELGTQFGEVVRVTIPINKLTMKKEEFGFIEFASPADAQYMRDVIQYSVAPLRLFDRHVTVAYKGDMNNSLLGNNNNNNGMMTSTGGGGGGGGRNNTMQDAAADALLDIGAKIVVYNLDLKKFSSVPECLDLIRKHFSQFGRLAVPPSVQQSTNTAIISFNTFEASDAAVTATDNQFLFGMEKKVRVMYAMREDGRGRHGSTEERALYSSSLSERQQAAATLIAQQQQQQMQFSTNNVVDNDNDDDVPNWAQGLNPYSQI